MYRVEVSTLEYWGRPSHGRETNPPDNLSVLRPNFPVVVSTRPGSRSLILNRDLINLLNTKRRSVLKEREKDITRRIVGKGSRTGLTQRSWGVGVVDHTIQRDVLGPRHQGRHSGNEY